ncbi:MAG: YolD-like family protein [Sporolactobacillus sp.]
MNKLSVGSNLRWEASRMMLPEHVKAVREAMQNVKADTRRPDIDVQEAERIDRLLQEAIRQRRPVQVYYSKSGVIKQKIVYPQASDSAHHLLICRDAFGLAIDLPLADILGITEGSRP